MVSPLTLGMLLVVSQGWRASTAPGPSSTAHASIADDCDACHMPFKGLPNEKCLTCHGDLKKFHASVSAQKCVACHLEHKGPEASLTRPAAMTSFDHTLTGMSLIGAHQKVACKTCHTTPIAKMVQTCVGCHKDTHQGSLGTSCTACHSSTAWKPALHQRNEHTVSMEGGHAKATCSSCHQKGKHLTPKVACSACHEEAHGGTKAACDSCHVVKAWTPATFDHSFCTCILPQKHQTVGCLGCHREWSFTKTPSVCSGCHDQERKHEPLGECSLCHSAVSWKKNQFNHNQRAKFKLAGEHLKVACENCHPATGATQKFRGVPQQCEGCHQKQGDAAHGNFGACSTCHPTTDAFKPSPFSHATTGFPLVGRHGKVSCKDCHQDKLRGYPKAPVPVKKAGRSSWLQGALAWLPTNDAVLFSVAPHVKEATCSHCHADPHQGSTKADGECSVCHTSEAWKPSTFTVERHASTPFPLTGKHATTSCKLCHFEPKLDDVPKVCSRCHVDRHDGRLGTTCEKCHTTTAFAPVPGFDHAVTGFTLDGKHAQATCADCHQGKLGKALSMVTSSPVKCGTCHQAQHGAELGSDCRACHEPSKGPFSKARGMTTQHQQTGFALERRHASLKCGTCHTAAGPPPTQRCASCHADPHSGQLGQGCEDCHQADRFRVVRFDHDRTGWPLRGRHFMAPCASCHTAQRWVGLVDECWDCHAAAAARGKAKAPEAHPFGPLECTNCHTSQWKW